jgi:hypothetical protein
MPVFLANESAIQLPGPAIGDILLLKMFGTHRGMNVMSNFMEQNVADPDLPKQIDPWESGGPQTQNNPVYSKRNIC